MLGVLNNTANNALKQNILPACTGAQATWNQSTYEGGTSYWCGTLNFAESAWNVTATGVVRNASNGSRDVIRTITAYVPVTPVVNQSNNNPAWNYIMSTATGAECDMVVNENILIEAALFARSLCLDNNADIRVGPVIVKGTIKLANNGSIGTSSNRIQVSPWVGSTATTPTRRSSTASRGGPAGATPRRTSATTRTASTPRCPASIRARRTSRSRARNGTPGTRTDDPAR